MCARGLALKQPQYVAMKEAPVRPFVVASVHRSREGAMSASDDDQEILDEFVQESRELLETAEADLMSLDPASGVDPEAIHRVFRAVHSVKGAAGFFGLEVIAGLGHALESVLMEIREGRLIPDRATVDVLLVSNDALRALVDDVASSNTVDVTGHKTALRALLEPKPAVEEVPQPPAAAPTAPPVAQGHQGGEAFELTAETVAALRRHGQRLYVLTVGANGPTVDAVVAQAETVGRVLHVDRDASAVTVASVLGPDIASVGFGLPKSWVALLPLDAGAEVEASPAASPEDAPPVPVPSMSASPPRQVAQLPVSRDEDSTDLLRAPPTAPELIHVGGEAVKSEDAAQKKGAKAEDTVRIKTRQLGSLMAKAGEMVLARNRLIRWLQDHLGENQDLSPILHDVSGITTALQEEIMQLRLQPVGTLFSKFNRVVRDLSRQLDKDVVLVTEGEDVELDRTILEGLSDPLTHLVRNSLDHGIESHADRERAGKPRRATVWLKAFHRNGRVNIEVVDDGGGIPVDRVKAKAVERSIITTEQAVAMSDAEAFSLLFAPGFSTAAQVTAVSGRGVGMDVVRTNIQELGGEVVISSVYGRGTTVTLTIPLTLAIVPALILNAASRMFVLPQVGLERVLRLVAGKDGTHVEHVGNAPVIRYEDGLLPLVHMGAVLDLEDAGWAAQEGPDRRVLVLRVGNERFGLVVDAIVDTEEIVVKPLSSYVRSCPCFSGVTILGDGEVAMILDPPGIVSAASLRLSDIANAGRAVAERRHEDVPEAVLVFSIGGEERFGLPLPQIIRIERVERSAVRRIAGAEFLTFGDRTLPLVRLEHYLPVEAGYDEPENLYVIVPRFGRAVGIVTHEVIDARTEPIVIDRSSITAPGLQGSVRLGGEVVLLLDVFQLLEQARPQDFTVPSEAFEVGGGLRALVVDGGDYSRGLHADYLRSVGVTVVEASDETEAVEIAANQAFDVLLVDLDHSGVDGFGVVVRVRDMVHDQPMHVIGLGAAVGEERQHALDAGLDDVCDRMDRNGILRSMVRGCTTARGVA